MGKLNEKLKSLPDSPGIYLMKDEKGRVIYVGKALSLKKRVRSYFGTVPESNPKLRMLVQSTRDLDYIVTDSQSSALILECNLIKKYRPRYNVRLRDDKKYPCIKISADSFPRISITRTLKKDSSRYYGPYTSAGAVRKTLKLMRKLFLLRSCRRDMSSPSRPCLYYHLGECLAPCTGRITQKEYAGKVQSACLFLEGKAEELLQKLRDEMKRESSALHFEKAALLRNRIDALRMVLEEQKTKIGDIIHISAPLLQHAEWKEAVLQLKELLKLKTSPSRIEAFDISQTGGTTAVGSVIVFEDGLPQSRYYRHFKIKSAPRKDDCAMIAEIVRRRYVRILREKRKLPDLILIDGGAGQLHSALDALENAGITDISVIGLAKRFEHIYSTGKSKPTILPPDSSALQLVRHVRDEAHRFAIGFHQRMRRKKLHESILDEIHGFGKKRKQLLLRNFKSIEKVAKATMTELQKIDGIGPELAKRIKMSRISC